MADFYDDQNDPAAGPAPAASLSADSSQQPFYEMDDDQDTSDGSSPPAQEQSDTAAAAPDDGTQQPSQPGTDAAAPPTTVPPVDQNGNPLVAPPGQAPGPGQVGYNGGAAGQPYPYDYGDSNPGTGYVGQNMPATGDLADWHPGQAYTGDTETPLQGTGETFTPSMDPNEGPQAVNWDVTADQTVQGQMDQLTQNMSTNPVYQSLAQSLERAQGAHGGQNSLMAESAAYNQVINLAYNVASQDAATYARSAEFNASTANQFALSNRQFMQQALLSTQNYQQSQVLQGQQIEGNLRSVSMQIAGQLQNTQIGANAQIASTQISAAAQRAAASTSAAATLGAAHIQQQTALQSIQANFESQWSLNEQQQGHALELNDRQTDNQIRSTIVQGNMQFGQQMTIQMNADNNANLRQLMGTVGQIGSTPGLTGEQQANAINQVTQMYHTNSALSAGFYGSSTYALNSGQAGAAVTGTPYTPGMMGPTSGAAGPGPTGTPGGPIGTTPSYDQYGDYLSYGQGGYTMSAPPVDPFYGGSGLVTSQGGIPSYGSNLDYEHQTGDTVDYNNQLTGSNPLGNNPGQTTGGGNYTGFLPPEGP
jgi:hypothetical protein